MRRGWIPAAVAVCALAGTQLAATGAASARAAPLCGSMAGQQPSITKVMWIFMENRSYGSAASEIPGSPSASYIDKTLIAQCGSTAGYDSVTHPSYPNYLAATSGSTQGSTSDTLAYYNSPNLFGQVDPSWRSYEEFMPTNCSHAGQTGNSTTLQYYVSKHNPASSYSSLPVGAPAGDCATNDEPLGTTTSGPLVTDVNAGTLPAFSFVTPGLCNDMHALPTGVSGCTDTIAGGDAWLAQWIPLLTSGPDYTSGHLLIDIAWDEARGGTAGQNCLGSTSATCLTPNIVISPYTAHSLSSTTFSHYSLLKMTETLLGKPYLGGAAAPTTINMCLDFGLCPQYANTHPTASFTASCSGATCTFDGSASAAPGSGITAFSWNFGDGGTGSGQTAQHTFAAAGTYQVSLTVTNEPGLTGTSVQQVTAGSGGPAISFIGAADANGNNPTESVTVPPAVLPADGLVLVATGAQNQPITGPPGWTLVGTDMGQAIVTSVWSRIAAAGDAGSKVTVTFGSTYRKGNLQLLAYRGTSASSPVAVFAANSAQGTSSTATTPQVTITQPGSWLVSGWAAKSSAVNSWAAPAGQLVRDACYGSGGGRIDMMIADGGGPAATGPAGGLTASTDQPFSADTALTLVLAPAS